MKQTTKWNDCKITCQILIIKRRDKLEPESNRFKQVDSR